MILQPQANFTVVRQIGDHTDVGTNYVQAVIRNAYTDEILATLNLTDKGGQRFKGDWKVSADPSGQGYYVSIVTSVYTDSGYTTKNANYADEENTYLVADRVGILTRSHGGGGISARDVRIVLTQELEKVLTPINTVFGAIGALQREINRIPKEQPEMQWEGIQSAIQEVKTAIAAIPTEQKEPDLAPLAAGIEKVLAAVNEKEVTPEADFAPVLAAIDALKTDVQEAEDEIISGQTDIKDALRAGVDEIKTMEFSIAPTTANGTTKKPEPEAVPFDVKQLAL